MIACTAGQCVCGALRPTHGGDRLRRELNSWMWSQRSISCGDQTGEAGLQGLCEEGVVSASLPPRIIEKGLASDRS